MAAVCVENGHPVSVVRRTNRSGFKAGAMVEGLTVTEGQVSQVWHLPGQTFDQLFKLPVQPSLHQKPHPTLHKISFLQTALGTGNTGDPQLVVVDTMD